MGRNKLEIKRLENSSSRQTTYSKRKNGILKKAHELSVLCDIPLALIMFSPGGKPSTCFGKHSIEEVIAKFGDLSPQDRIKRRLEVLEALKKTFKKLNHDVNIQDCLGTSTPVKVCMDSRMVLMTLLEYKHDLHKSMKHSDTINNLELLTQMEDSLEKSLEQIHKQKENFQKKRRVSLETSNELPFRVTDEQQLPLLWTPSDSIQQVVLTQEPNLPAQREMESCTGSTSGSYFGCLRTTSRSDSNSPGQRSGMDNIGQDAFQGQFSGQYPYLPHGIHMQEDSYLQAVPCMDQGQSSVSYNVGGNYQPSPSCHFISNHLPFETPTDSAFGDYFNYQYQKQLTIPAATTASIYERIARDPSHILFDNTQNHFP